MNGALADHDAERAVLGGMLVNNATIPQAEALLRAEHFDRMAHRTIYGAMVELSASGRAVDLVTLKASLGEALGASGGVSYLSGLLDGVPMMDNLEAWARIVKDKARRRAALWLGRKLVEEAEAEDIETGELLDGHQAKMARLVEADDRKLRRMGDYLPEAMSSLESFTSSETGITGIETGIADFDRLTCGLGKGWLMILGARPARGKSALCAQATVHAAQMGKRVLVFSMEMPGAQVTERTLLSEAGVGKWELRNGRAESAWADVNRAYGRLSDLPIWLECSEMPSLAHVRAVAQQMKARHGLDMIVVDHLQRMRTEAKKDRWEAVGDLATGLKSLALRLDIPIIAACQLNRDAHENRPSMANLQQAQNIISQEADVIALLHPAEPQKWGTETAPAVHMIVDKFRHGQGMDIRLRFLKSQVRFEGAVPDAMEWSGGMS